jgi:ABC-type transport system involved in cytochrome c biogenesis permease subunit
MKRSWNPLLWVGFATALLAALSYLPVFTRFPITRDIPWVNLLLFLVSLCLLTVGLHRAFAHSDRYRGKIIGSVLTALSLALAGLFCFGVFYGARNIPSPATALRVSQQAPDFTLSDANGKPQTLAQLRQGKRAVLLIFYRGYW